MHLLMLGSLGCTKIFLKIVQSRDNKMWCSVGIVSKYKLCGPISLFSKSHILYFRLAPRYFLNVSFHFDSIFSVFSETKC